MNYRSLPGFLLLAGLALCGLARSEEWTSLLDKELSHWETYLSFRHAADYRGEAPVDADGALIEPIGYGSDPTGVFTTEEKNGQTLLRISGEYYGCLISKQEYRNYRLKVKARWGERIWEARQGKLRDAGILYHSIGDAGVDYWRSWMLSQEFQIMEGHMGDYWNIANSAIDIRAYLPEGAMNAIASPTQPFLPMGAPPRVASFCLRSENRESPPGEWTELELVCFEGKSLHIVNGEVVMVLRDSRFMVEGQPTPLLSGKLQLQSESCEVYLKDIRIQIIDTLPKRYKALFE